MIKIAMIGAGSVVFSRNLTGDILSFPEFRNTAISYMDVDRERLEVGAALCKKAAAAIGASPVICATMDRRQAMKDADFVINMMQVGGFDSTLIDFEIPRKYGLNFTIADTTGPGGMFRALRTFPVLRDLCREMEEVCPRALLLNYANPMSMNMQTVAHCSGTPAVGLCHSVQGTLNDLMAYIDEKPEDVAFTCAGINHMAFYLRLEKNGEDLYPRLFRAMADPAIRGGDSVRFELMKRLGYFVTESSEHSAEYSPFFIPHGPAHSAKYNVPIDEYLRRCDCSVDEFERLAALSRSDAAIDVRRSREYGSTIIHSIVTGKPAVVYGNMPNRGAIANLPANAIAEAPTLVDRSGLRFTTVGELPPQLLGYIQPHMTQHELFIRAAMEGRRDHVYQAAMFDPLTAATLTLDQIVEMCDELIAAHGFVRNGGFLPDLDAKKTLVPTSGQAFAPTNPQLLREQRKADCRKGVEEYIKDWHVIGPFPAGHGNRRGLDLATPVEASLDARLRDSFRAGSALRTDLSAKPGAVRSADPTRIQEMAAIHLGAECRFGNQTFRWTPVRANACGFVDLGAAVGQVEWAVAYAYAEVFSDRARDIVLRGGSDDGIKIRVNGNVVHHHEVGRGYRADSDRAPAHLEAGINRILVKIDNYTGGWGFGIAIPGA